MKCLISVIAHNEEPFIKLENGIRESWMKHNINNDIIFYYGNSEYNNIIGDRLYLNTKNEGIPNIGHKTIKMFEYCLNNYEFDYIFRTNCSSYVRIDKLNEYLINKPRTNFYNAVIMTHEPVPFASGCGYSISRDLVEIVVKNKEKWNHSYLDDVALALLLSGENIKPTHSSRFDINEYNMHNLDNLHLDNFFHFRCKCSDRNDDVKIFNILDKKFNSK
jgi:hypothetical protein